MTERAFSTEIPDEQSMKRYYRLALERIEAGDTVWIQRDFNSDIGRVIDLFSDNQHIGFIYQHLDGMRCEVYLNPSDDPNGIADGITDDLVEFDEAVELLQAAIPPLPTD